MCTKMRVESCLSAPVSESESHVGGKLDLVRKTAEFAAGQEKLMPKNVTRMPCRQHRIMDTTWSQLTGIRDLVGIYQLIRSSGTQ